MSRRLPWILVALIAAVLVARFVHEQTSGGSEAGGEVGAGAARVVRVVDGDTIQVEQHGRTDRVRYIGVDTPETVKPGAAVQCFGHQASRENSQLVQGQAVRLVLGEEPRDRYDRLLAYVYRRADGVFVNEALLAGGYARTLTIPPNDRFAQRFAALQDRARQAQRGLWGAC